VAFLAVLFHPFQDRPQIAVYNITRENLANMGDHAILAAIGAEIMRLQQARSLLSRRAVKKATKKVLVEKTRKRTLSADARAKIAAAQRKRWAAARNATKG